MSGVPFFRPAIGEEEIAAVSECLASGWLTTGPRARAFETAFAERIGGGVEAIAVNSATSALHLALEAAGVGPGDEVVLPTLTFTATAEVVRYLGATPVLADIDPETLCLDPEAAAATVTHATRAVMPVHFAGRPCDVSGFLDLARRHDLALVCDAAHALPASHQGTPIGAEEGAHTAFSFYANKTMTTGEGGMLTTRDPAIATRARVMRLHGIDRDVFDRFSDPRAGWLYDVVAPGFKYNLTDVAAALGLVQLGKIDEFRRLRAERVARYDEAFAGLPVRLPPRAAAGDEHSWHLYILQLADEAPLRRDELILALKERGIGCSVHYRPLHQMTVWASPEAGAFPNADAYFENCLSLPLFMTMTDAEQEQVIEGVHDLLRG